MTTYHTNHPIGSTDPRDLYDNAENLDIAINTKTELYWNDRLGVSRKSYYGMEKEFEEFLANSGYQDIGDYAAGLVISTRNQVFVYDGEFYRAGADLELPFTATGNWAADSVNFVAVGDAVLRQQLATAGDHSQGAWLIGYEDGQTVGSALSKSYETEPFGRGGMRIIAGEKGDLHYGFGGVINFPSGKWVNIYRKAPHHGQSNGAELRAMDSYDNGATWVNDRLIYSDPENDARPDAPRLMSNGRGGFFVNRQAASGGQAKFPLFVSTDDEGVTFSQKVVQTASISYTFQGHSGLMNYPSSQGGNDANGYITFGFVAAGGLGALSTVDNGENWQIVTNVANPVAPMASISESMGFQIPGQDKFIFFSRAAAVGGGWLPRMTVWVTSDMKNWGTPMDSGLNLYGNPPGGLFDPETNKWHQLNFGRAGRGIDGQDHHILTVSVDADELYNANGDFASLGLSYRVAAAVPSWATGYISPFKQGSDWFATFTCGEPGTAGGSYASIALVGDFVPTGMDQTILADLMGRNAVGRTLTLSNSTDLMTYDERGVSVPLGKSFTVRSAASQAEGRLFAIETPTGSRSYAVDTTNTVINSGGGSYTTTLNGANANYIVTASRILFGLTAKPPAADARFAIDIPGATKSAMIIEAGTAAARTAVVFTNANGVVGTIAVSGSETSYNTTSDERFKTFSGNLDGDDAIDVIKRDPVRVFEWKDRPESGPQLGWGAQTSYGVCESLCTPGGWYLPILDEPCEEGDFAFVDPISGERWEEGGYRFDVSTGYNEKGDLVTSETKIEAMKVEAQYRPWVTDHSKRAPYLWAALSKAIEKIEALETKLADIESRMLD